MNIIQEAQQHFKQAQVSDTSEIPLSDRWTLFTKIIDNDINALVTPQDAIFYAQSKIAFDHRGTADPFYLLLYRDVLKSEFPHFLSMFDELGDSPHSLPHTLARDQGHLVSNVFFWHLRYVLQCLTHVKEPEIVCEIGGGYGGPARLWLQNPIFRPRCYVDIDLPESLFFAEVFLKVNFDDLKLLYVTNPGKLEQDVVSRYSVILCPTKFIDAISSLSFDLVINTGSLQEMTEEWVDFWMQWLREQDCRWFYSLNYFAQPLGNMAESKNSWSPRLTPEWTARLLTFNPPFTRLQSLRNWAEILAEKESPVPSQQTLLSSYQLTKDRILDGQVLLEAIDIVRLHPDEVIIWDLLLRCITEMPTIPKEAWYLANYLAKYVSVTFYEHHGEQFKKLHQQLDSIRSGGQENLEHLKGILNG